ncbi:type II secretion system protein K [Polymorphobacter multimanifer]|uniref:Type II secretion system protein K n=1 Tax=Polymorphobacter multimanifer TaxID=1070431 RepID=A0A841L4I9_9SPHN|nr:type II secretion system minor pseudopilin GspK [Polymorphobacter multimanifer]MBB6227554.1 general secretion pathway protein K [Polymorphobacter multimanifer]GGI94259.1 type II secretion system protein K [Polymorphobacter multimanifer]
MKGKPSERGAALLAVLLLVGVMGAIAALLLERTRTATQLVGNLLAREQATSLGLVAEALAVQRIGAITQASDRATQTGGWQGQPIMLPLPGGTASITPRDGGNCFNLGSLVTQAGPESLVTRPLSVAQFTSLMLALGIPDPRARGIAAAAADWIDSDDQPAPLGAEDSRYGPQGYRTAGTLMADATELRAVAGVDAETWARLRPFVCALPLADLSPINPNTLLPAQAPLLAMLLPETLGPPPARLALASRVLAARPATGWGSVADFANTELLRGEPLPGDVLQQLTVRTGWFRLALRLESGDTSLAGTSLIDARRSPVLVAQRRWQDED